MSLLCNLVIFLTISSVLDRHIAGEACGKSYQFYWYLALDQCNYEISRRDAGKAFYNHYGSRDPIAPSLA